MTGMERAIPDGEVRIRNRATRDGQLSTKRTLKLNENEPPDEARVTLVARKASRQATPTLHCFTSAIRRDFRNGAARPSIWTAFCHSAPAFATVACVIVESPLAIGTCLQARPLSRRDGICYYGHDITSEARFGRFHNQLRRAIFPSGLHTECSAVEPFIQCLVTGRFSLARTAQIST